MQVPDYHVLLVEGDAGERRRLQQMLGEAVPIQFELAQTACLDEALDPLGKSRPDVVLLGVDRPEEHGFETLAQIRDHSPAVPVVVLAGDDDQTVALQAIRLGAQDCLAKGRFTSDQLARTLCHAIERKRAEEAGTRADGRAVGAADALREEEEKYQLLFETMAQGVVYQSADGTITSANPAAERLLGVTLDQLQGRTSFDPRWRAIREDGSEFPGEEHPAMVALRTGTPVENVIMGVFHPAKEEWRWIVIHAIPQFHDRDGSPQQVYTTFRDITAYRQSQAQLQASLREKEILLQEIHHRVKNNLQVISSLLELQAAGLQDPESVRAFEESQNRIWTIGLIHEKLYNEADLNSIYAPDYFRELLDQLFSLYTSVSRPVSILLDCDPIQLAVRVAIPCGLIVNELVSNALQHAFPPDSVGGEALRAGGEALQAGGRTIRVGLRRQGKDQLVLTTSDNGLGLPPEQNLSDTQTLGLRLVELLAQQLGGTVQINRDAGTAFAVTFDGGQQVASDGGQG